EYLERAVAVSGVEPSAVSDHAVGPGDVVVHSASGVALDADEEALAEEPFERDLVRVDDIDRSIRAVGQVVLGAMRIDPADVIREQRGARNLNRGEALGFSVGRRPGPGAGAEGRAAKAERGGTGQHIRKRKAS